MIMELLKSDKKAAKEILETALQRDFEESLNKSEELIQNWKSGKKTPKDAYHDLYKHISKFDKFITKRYDNLSSSSYLLCIIGLYLDNVIDNKDLENFSDEVQEYIKSVAKNLI